MFDNNDFPALYSLTKPFENIIFSIFFEFSNEIKDQIQ